MSYSQFLPWLNSAAFYTLTRFLKASSSYWMTLSSPYCPLFNNILPYCPSVSLPFTLSQCFSFFLRLGSQVFIFLFMCLLRTLWRYLTCSYFPEEGRKINSRRVSYMSYITLLHQLHIIITQGGLHTWGSTKRGFLFYPLSWNSNNKDTIHNTQVFISKHQVSVIFER